MMQVKLPGSVQVSPDGRRVVFTIKEAIIDGIKNEYVTRIYLANSDGSGQSELLVGDEPRWSADGKTIAYLSNRSGRTNVWAIHPVEEDRAPRMLTNSRADVNSFKWAPDGLSVAFTATDPAAPGDDQHSGLGVRVVDSSYLMNRLYVQSLVTNLDDKSGERVMTVGNYSVGSDKYGLSDYDWSPDGKTIVFSHTRTPDADDWPSSDISLVDVKYARVRSLVQTGAAEGEPLFSRDGRWIAYLASDDPANRTHNDRVHVIPTNGGKPRALAETEDSFGLDSYLIGWSANDKDLYYLETEGTKRTICALPMNGQPRSVTHQDGVLSDVSLNQSGVLFGFTYETTAMAPEAFVSRTESFNPVRISQANRALTDSIPLGRTEVIHWKSVDGAGIEGLLTYPISYEPGHRYPLLLIIHGGPADVFTQTFIGRPNYPVAAFASRGYVILRCNVRGSSGYGKNFRRAIIKDWGGRDVDDLIAGVDHLIGIGIADGNRMGVMGWSYGGFLTASTITRTRRFRGASIGAGPMNLLSYAGTTDIPGYVVGYFRKSAWDSPDYYLARSPISKVASVTTPTLIIHGEQDPRVPISQSFEFYHALKRQGCTVEMVVYPRTGHWPNEPKLLLDLMSRNIAWFDKYVRNLGS